MSSVLLLALALQQAGSASASEAATALAEEAPRPVIEWAELPSHVEMPEHLRDSVRLGYVRVPQDHGDPTGPMQRMAFVIIASRTPAPAPDPVVFIVGGPGTSGIEAHMRTRLRGPHVLDVHRARRDLIVFDQRGNGLSEPRTCDELGEAWHDIVIEDDSTGQRMWLDALTSCRSQLVAEGVRLETLGSVQVAHDLEWLRRALGAPQLNLAGTSYGSRIAAETVRQVPEAVRAAQFSAPVPPGRYVGSSDTDRIDEVRDRLFERCAGLPACRAAYPRLEEEWDSVLVRLRRNPVRVNLAPSASGREVELLVDDSVMRDGLGQLLVNRELAAGVPLLIHTIFERGDALLPRLAPMVAQAVTSPPDNPGTFLAFHCNDGVVNRASAEALRQQCLAWIGETWDHPGSEPLRSDVPALIDTGELDPRTPPSYARFLAAGLPRAHVVIVPWHGHEAPPTCAMQIAASFVDAPERAPDRACLESVPPIDFATGVVYSGWIGAAAMRTWERPWLAALPGTAALLLLVSAVGIPMRQRRARLRRPVPAEQAASYALLLGAMLGLLFIASLVAAMIAGARRHLFVPAIGLHQNWAWVLAMPWVMLVLVPIAAVLVVRSRVAGHPVGIAGWSALLGSGLLLAMWVVNLLA